MNKLSVSITQKIISESLPSLKFTNLLFSRKLSGSLRSVNFRADSEVNFLLLLKALLLILVLCILVACGRQSEAETNKIDQAATTVSEVIEPQNTGLMTPNSITVGNIPVYDFKTFEPLLHINNDTTYIVNFWATWCKPCVAELPYFEQLHEAYKNEKVKVLLVSLDFSNQIEKKLIPFMEKRQLKPKVVVLDDPDANGWIDKVDPTWSGAIPATIIFKGEKRGFFERSFEKYEDLVEVMKEVVK